MSLAYETSEETVSPFRYMVALSGAAPESNDYKSFALLLCYSAVAASERFGLPLKAPETLVLPLHQEARKSFISPETKLSCGQQESLETGSC